MPTTKWLITVNLLLQHNMHYFIKCFKSEIKTVNKFSSSACWYACSCNGCLRRCAPASMLFFLYRSSQQYASRIYKIAFQPALDSQKWFWYCSAPDLWVSLEFHRILDCSFLSGGHFDVVVKWRRAGPTHKRFPWNIVSDKTFYFFLKPEFQSNWGKFCNSKLNCWFHFYWPILWFCLHFPNHRNHRALEPISSFFENNRYLLIVSLS